MQIEIGENLAAVIPAAIAIIAMIIMVKNSK